VCGFDVKGHKKASSKGAKLLILLGWAWVELNYRPHAYQATEGE
jgi:hypothetical protein